MIVTTGDINKDYEIIGICRGVVPRGKMDMEVCFDAAMARMVENAEEMGADAVILAQFTELGSLNYIDRWCTAYGTAVRFRRSPIPQGRTLKSKV